MSKVRTKTVRVDRTKHKTQAYTVTELGRIDKTREERYVTERTASIGAVRACRDWLSANKGERITILLPDNRQREGSIFWRTGEVMLWTITKSKVIKRRK